jgi:hypothetical protein
VVAGQAVSVAARRLRGEPRLVAPAGATVSSGGVPRIGVACGTPIARPTGGCGLAAVGRNSRCQVSETLDSTARDRVDDVTVGGECAAGGRAARRGELRLVVERDDADARERAAASGRGARRLRIAPAVQLELACAPPGARPAVVWDELPADTREALLVVLARLIGAGALEERS